MNTSGNKPETNGIYNAIPDATLVGSIVLAYMLDSVFPIARIIPFPFNLAGWVVVVVGFGAAIYIINALKAKHTSTDATGTPSQFITTGVFSISRNPFYLCYVVTAMGMAIIFGSLAAFVAPVICFAAIQLAIIPIEEANLQRKYGHSYEQYRRSVHRWI